MSLPLKPPPNGAPKSTAIGKIQPARSVPGKAIRLRPAPAGSVTSDAQITRIISNFQSDTAEIINSPDPLLARSTLFIMLFLFVTGLTWAAMAKLDRVVSARGTMVSVDPMITIQPFDNALVRNLSAREGDVVKAGAVLATLDATFNAADVAQLDARLASVSAQAARLEAEMIGAVLPEPTPKESETITLQYGLWKQRLREYEARQRAYTENLARLESVRQSKTQEIKQLQEQGLLIDEMLEMRRQLTAAQLSSRLNLLIAEREKIAISRSISASSAELQQIGHQIQSTIAEREVFVKQWSSEISNTLIRLNDERQSLNEQLTKARKRLSMVELSSPVDAVVVEVSKKSVGSVVTAAQPLIRLAPLNSAMEVEAYVPAKDVGHVDVGEKVAIKLDAYGFLDHGLLEGEIITISEDALRDATGSTSGPAYKVRVKITGNKLRNLPEMFRLIPGMPLTAEIKVGARSVLAYFLRPITRGVEEGLREP